MFTLSNSVRAIVFAVGLVGAMYIYSSAVVAAPYGAGDYGECTYSRTCSAPAKPPQTVIELPRGTDAVVNLEDGQTIPRTGYTIIVSPIDGADTDFASVEFYVDDMLVGTYTPGEDGKVRWTWDPRKHPGSKLTLVVTDTSGQKTTKTFNIQLVDMPAATGSVSNEPKRAAAVPDNSWFIPAAFHRAATAVRDTIKRMPAPVVYAFPYIVFILLAIEIIVLIFQAQRELKELRTAQALLVREQEAADMKRTFLELVSHYLRTPLTILQAGTEGLVRKDAASQTAQAIQAATKRLHDAVETAIVQSEPATSAVSGVTPAVPVQVPARSAGHITVGQLVFVWFPVVLVGIIAFGFVYLANAITEFSANAVQVLTQVIVYSLLIVVVLQVVRRAHLQRADLRATEHLIEQESAMREAQELLMTDTAASLHAQITALEKLAASMPADAADMKFVQKGIIQLKAVDGKFRIASLLKGATSPDPYSGITTRELYGKVAKAVAQQAQDKSVTIEIVEDTELYSRSSGLLAIVLESLLDNAIAYSPNGGTVRIDTSADHNRTSLSVIDQGSGISADKQHAIFSPFYKAEGAETFSHEGMGFSLYLDKIIMNYLGGDIELSSEPGRGTLVTASWAVAS